MSFSRGRYLCFAKGPYDKDRTPLALHTLANALTESADDEDTAVYFHHDKPVAGFAWSADGSRFATVTATHLYVFSNLERPRPRPAKYPLKTVARSVCWSPDGAKLAIVGNGELSILKLISAAGAHQPPECLAIPAPLMAVAKPHRVGGPDGRPCNYPIVAWSPDGRKILCADKDPGVYHSSALCIYRVEGSDETILAAPIQVSRCFVGSEDEGPIQAARWSPDSARIALAGGGYAGEQAVKIFDVEHRNLLVLENWSGADTDTVDNVSWYDDGSAVVCNVTTYENSSHPINTYAVPSATKQQAFFDGDNGGDDGGDGDGDGDGDEDPDEAEYYKTRVAEVGPGYRINAGGGAYKFERQYLQAPCSRNTADGQIDAIAQGKLARGGGIDPHSSELVVYTMPMPCYEDDDPCPWSWKPGRPLLKCVNLPNFRRTTATRSEILRELMRGLFLVTAERATLLDDADAADLAKFYGVVGRLRARRPWMIPFVLAFIPPVGPWDHCGGPPEDLGRAGVWY